MAYEAVAHPTASAPRGTSHAGQRQAVMRRADAALAAAPCREAGHTGPVLVPPAFKGTKAGPAYPEDWTSPWPNGL